MTGRRTTPPYILAVTRMAWDPRTRAYVVKRRAEGKSTKEIIRCLKRHIARELYRLLVPLDNEPAEAHNALAAAAACHHP